MTGNVISFESGVTHKILKSEMERLKELRFKVMIIINQVQDGKNEDE